jgi:hypothetical protein
MGLKEKLAKMYEVGEAIELDGATKDSLKNWVRAEFIRWGLDKTVLYTDEETPYRSGRDLAHFYRERGYFLVTTQHNESPVFEEYNLEFRALHDLAHILNYEEGNPSGFDLAGEIEAFMLQASWGPEWTNVLFSEIVLQAAYFSVHEEITQKLVMVGDEVVNGFLL